jgi:hypothetical protein
MPRFHLGLPFFKYLFEATWRLRDLPKLFLAEVIKPHDSRDRTIQIR